MWRVALAKALEQTRGSPRTPGKRLSRHGLRTTVVLCFVAGVLTMQAPAATAGHLPAIWVGSPVVGNWGLSGNWSTVPPNHHMLVKADPDNDWSVDLTNIPSNNRGVFVYAAPSNSAYNNRVTARVTQIIDDNACRYGGGADMVTVGFYLDGALYGRATYAHLDRNPSLYQGMPIGRWGSWIGDVATWASGGPNCWTGPHVHFELRAESHYACWSRVYTYPGSPIASRTNFLGFVSGPLSGYPSRACP